MMMMDIGWEEAAMMAALVASMSFTSPSVMISRIVYF